MRFRAELVLAGKTATGVTVPPEVVEALGAGRQPPVQVTIGAHTYRSTVFARGSEFKLPVSAENRTLAGVEAGETVEVELRLDTGPRALEAPPDLDAALAPYPDARRWFDGLTASQQSTFVDPIVQAKKPETRQARVAKAVAALREGRKRP
jgi:Bacteriocin-protection, YdeI or OmpD-Associated/Domain of unknown function (DUF1905)